MRAAIYARVSTEEQGTNFSIGIQEGRLREECKRNGYLLSEDHVSVDIGYSGATLVRPGLRRLLRAVEDGQVDIVLVHKLDRLFRSNRHMYNTLHEFEKKGVAFRSVTENFDTSTAMGKAYLGIAATFAEWERNTFIERSQEGMRKAVESGKYSGGIIPYGYRLNQGTSRLEVDEKEAEVVKLIFQLCVEEKLSTKKIADRLNAIGYLPRYAKSGIKKREPGKRAKKHTAALWRAGRINNMLHNTAYYGEWWYGKRSEKRKRDDWIKGVIPPIVRKEQFDKAQAQLNANLRWSPRNARRQYLLRGLIKCGACGLTYCGAAWKVKGGERRYYKCNGRTQHRGLYRGKCPSITLRAGEIEELVWNDIKGFVRQPEVVLAQLRAKQKPVDEDVEHRLLQVEDALKEKDKAEKRLLELYAADSKVSRQTLDETLEKMSRERSELQVYRKELMTARQRAILSEGRFYEVERLLDAVGQRIEEATFEEKRNACERLVKEIVVTTEGDRPKATITYRFAEPEVPKFYLQPARMSLRILW